MILIFLVVTSQFALSQVKLLQFPAMDFETFYLSGKQVLSGGNPYLKIASDIPRNPPPALLLFSFFALFPILQSQLIWFIFSLLGFLIGSYFLFKTFEKEDGSGFFCPSNLKLWLIYLTLVFTFFPFRFNLGSGQMNNILFLLISLAFYFSIKKKASLSALMLLIGICLKITPLFLVFTLILEKQFKIVKQVFLLLLITVAATPFLLGREIYRYYLAIPSSFFDFRMPVYYNQSLSAFLSRIGIDGNLTRMILVLSLAAAIILLLKKTLKIPGESFNSRLIIWNISILYMLLFAPFAWQYHFVIMIFPFASTAYLIYKSGFFRFFWLLGLAYTLSAFNIRNPRLYSSLPVFGSFILSHLFFGAMILLLINLYLTARIKA